MNAAQITKQSGSNLALAFISLGRERRGDISMFYAFCRVIDDLVDSTELSRNEKQRGLDTWRRALHASTPEESPLAPGVRGLLAKYPSLSPRMLEDIIDGVAMDLTVDAYPDFAALRSYCYLVASAVGLVSIEIFGYRNRQCREYAIELGLALQLTNIIRDVGKDLRFGRVYLPAEDLARFGYTEADLRAQTYDNRFLALMTFEAARAKESFARAEALLPREDRRSMMAAEIMRAVYASLLRKIEADGFRVFEKEYRLSRLEKAGKVAGKLLNFF